MEKNTILYKNWETFKFFRDLKKTLQTGFNYGGEVEIIYLLGNHDRLCNVYPSVRDRVKELLGVSDSSFFTDHKGERWFRYELIDPSYGIYARHGHHCDTYNCCRSTDCYDRAGNIQVPIGDVITTEFAVKIPWQMNLLSKELDIDPGVILGLKDLDNVRPLSRILEWIYYRIKDEDRGRVREGLNRTLGKVVSDLLDIELVQKWRTPGTRWDEVLRTVSNPWVNWIPKGILNSLSAEDLLPLFLGLAEGPSLPEKDVNVLSAYNDTLWRREKDIRYIVNGHTHAPSQIPLDCDRGREVFYINTGTWRNRIYRTVGFDAICDFVELKQMSYAIFYRPDEDNSGKEPNTHSFEVWSGTKKKTYARPE